MAGADELGRGEIDQGRGASKLSRAKSFKDGRGRTPPDAGAGELAQMRVRQDRPDAGVDVLVQVRARRAWPDAGVGELGEGRRRRAWTGARGAELGSGGAGSGQGGRR
jgi:hypothetical protein